MFSYRWIELPFWKKSLKNVPPKAFVAGSLAAFSLILAAMFYVQRFSSGKVDYSAEQIISIRIDRPSIYPLNCDAWYEHSKVEPCVFGSDDAAHTVVLLGDGIGAQWFSAIEQIYVSRQWWLVVLTKSACPMVDEDYFYPTIGKVYDVCSQWRDDILRHIGKYRPDVIIIGSSAAYNFSSVQWIEGSKRVFAKLSPIAEHVVVLSGTPSLGFDGPTCLARHLGPNGELSQTKCIGEKSTKNYDEVAEYLSISAKDFANVRMINLVNLVCPDGRCIAVSPEGYAIFRDSQHLTDTFVRSQVEVLRKQLPLQIYR